MAILYTPQTPRPKYFTLVVVALLSVFNPLFGQQQYIPGFGEKDLQPLPMYEASLKAYHNRKWTAERKEFTLSNKKKWWYYLPTVGLQFGLPSVQFGTGTLSQIDRDKIVNGAKLEGLDATARLTYQEDLLELRTQYEVLRLDMTVLLDQNITAKLASNLLQIAEEGYKTKQIAPKDWYSQQLQHIQAEQALEQQRRQLIIRVIQLERFAHYNLPTNDIAYTTEPDCEEIIAREK